MQTAFHFSGRPSQKCRRIGHNDADKSKTRHFSSTLLGMQIILCDLEGLLFHLHLKDLEEYS